MLGLGGIPLLTIAFSSVWGGKNCFERSDFVRQQPLQNPNEMLSALLKKLKEKTPKSFKAKGKAKKTLGAKKDTKKEIQEW